LGTEVDGVARHISWVGWSLGSWVYSCL
jgi:hypothetical protein